MPAQRQQMFVGRALGACVLGAALIGPQRRDLNHAAHASLGAGIKQRDGCQRVQGLQILVGLVSQSTDGVDDGINALQMLKPCLGCGAGAEVQRRLAVSAAHHGVVVQQGQRIHDMSAQKACAAADQNSHTLLLCIFLP
ncbi:hypothetical protein SDC9_174064 [bioreactor metagenome]|uniref:Uncharacterized protein n=1 Tax=bioreactor metagenome TaxID=1076179 RepID=A0A645GLA8_9ZZZZ